MKLLYSLIDIEKNGGKFCRKPRHFVSCSTDAELTEIYAIVYSEELHKLRASFSTSVPIKLCLNLVVPVARTS